MAALSRRESEERQAAALRFFIENPRATGDEMQRALTAGRLTGKKGPPMGIGMLYKLKRRAEEMARQGQKPPAIAPRPDFESTAEEHLQKLRETAKELQRMLSETTGNVLEVHITRDGVRVVRMRATEEQL
jgi:hypothetical protein